MEFLLIFGGVCLVGWFIDQLGKKPPAPPPPQSPQQAEQKSLDQLHWEKLLREHFQKGLELQKEADLEEWRAKYRKYLQSPKWKRVRKRVLEEANYTCVHCGGHATQVHHRKYTQGHKAGEFKRENYDYLEAICTRCHMEKHDI